MTIATTSETGAEVGPNMRMRAAIASTAGAIIEGFDFLAYGTATALVFNKLFFPTVDSTVGTLAAFGAFAAGFFARPVGGVVFGHYGDRLGRKTMLTLSLLVMGVATVSIGALPTYASAGTWAAVLLVGLRLVQGVAFGGELAGAALMAVEHAPRKMKSLFGSLPQMGSPVGLLLSTGAFALATLLPEEDFLSWGWRVPFLASSILVAIGIFIRLRVAETPEFEIVKCSVVELPVRDVVLRHWEALLLTAGGKLGEVTLYFTIVVFVLSFATTQLGFSRNDALHAIVVGAAFQVVTIPFFGWLGDRLGTRRLYIVGGLLLAVMAIPLLNGIGSGSHFAFQTAVVLGLAFNYAVMFGPQSLLFAAQFPTELRYSGVSLGIQIAAASGGGLAPVVATGLVKSFGSLTSVGFYLSALGFLSAVCAYFMLEPAGE